MNSLSDAPTFLTVEPPRVIAGIGSRKTPGPVQAAMTARAVAMTRAGARLRTGGAQGADQAFLAGMDPALTENYIPFDGFEGFRRGLPGVCFPEEPAIREEASRIAKAYHPSWDRCTPAARSMHTRNVFQVLGADLASPADLVVCWTPGAALTGGTAQALRIAAAYGVPVENIATPDALPVEAVLSVESEQAAWRNLTTPEYPSIEDLPKPAEGALDHLRDDVRRNRERGRWLRALGDRVAYGEWIALVGPRMDDPRLDALSAAIRGLALQRRARTHTSTAA